MIWISLSTLPEEVRLQFYNRDIWTSISKQIKKLSYDILGSWKLDPYEEYMEEPKETILDY